MKHIVNSILIAAAFLAIAFLAGCHDGVLPGEIPLEGLYGQVTDPEGVGIPNINVFSFDGTNYWSDVTDENGFYNLPDITPGSHVIAFYGTFWTTGYLGLVISATGTEGNITLQPSELSAVPPPVVTVGEPDINSQVGLVNLEGSITNLDVERAVLTVNGSSTLITTVDGAFNTTVILQPGVNTIYIWAANSNTYDISDPIIINFTPTGPLYFRVTLTWDGASDIDLHTWDPNLAHSYYFNQIIPTGELDIDNRNADGPENFTCTALADGRFRIAVNSFSLQGNPSRQAIIRVAVSSGPNAGNVYTFGPYTFTSDNPSNETYPVTGNTTNWWRPCDVLVSGSNISVVAADGTSLSESAGMTRGKN